MGSFIQGTIPQRECSAQEMSSSLRSRIKFCRDESTEKIYLAKSACKVYEGGSAKSDSRNQCILYPKHRMCVRER